VLTPKMEDYLETIYRLLEEKGYACATDIARFLRVKPPSVTRMIQKLARKEYLVYERYRGILLTPEGKKAGRFLAGRHRLLRDLLLALGLRDSTDRIVEGIEHFINGDALVTIERLVRFLRSHPEVLDSLAGPQPPGQPASSGMDSTATGKQAEKVPGV